MFSNNVPTDKEQNRWQFNDETLTIQSNKIDNQSLFAMPPNGNSFTYNDKIEIININDRNPVSFWPFKNSIFANNEIVQSSITLQLNLDKSVLFLFSLYFACTFFYRIFLFLFSCMRIYMINEWKVLLHAYFDLSFMKLFSFVLYRTCTRNPIEMIDKNIYFFRFQNQKFK